MRSARFILAPSTRKGGFDWEMPHAAESFQSFSSKQSRVQYNIPANMSVKWGMTLERVARMCGRLAPLCVCFTALLLGSDPAITIYNQEFAVVRETLSLDLKTGNNNIRFSAATAQVEPDSDRKSVV